jgi:hypothetical protein
MRWRNSPWSRRSSSPRPTRRYWRRGCRAWRRTCWSGRHGCSVGRLYIHDSRPRANIFLARSLSLRESVAKSASASTSSTSAALGGPCQLSREPSSRGDAAYPTLARLRLENSSVSTMMLAPRGTSARLAFRAAGFIATSTSGASPGVRTSWSAKCNWKLETPGRVPWGARISAGKLGRVAKSLPRPALSAVNRSPVNCMPSPESPAKRMTTRESRVRTGVSAAEGLLNFLPHSLAGDPAVSMLGRLSGPGPTMPKCGHTGGFAGVTQLLPALCRLLIGQCLDNIRVSYIMLSQRPVIIPPLGPAAIRRGRGTPEPGRPPKGPPAHVPRRFAIPCAQT